MKRQNIFRLSILALLICVLFCGCKKSPLAPTGTDVPMPTQATTEPEVPTQATTEPEVPTQAATEPVAQTQPKMVRIYVLTQSDAYDSGCTKYYYNEDYNVEKIDVFYVENDLASSTTFKTRDLRGMPCQAVVDWGEDFTETYEYSWSEEGKLLEEAESNGFTAMQFTYDERGNLLKIEEYYEGELVGTFHYEYDGDVLQGMYCMNTDEHVNYECLTENGFITEKRCYDEEGYHVYSYYYTYDENGNLAEVVLIEGGEQYYGITYTYEAVEVEEKRAAYILEQQKYLLSSDLEFVLPPMGGEIPAAPVFDSALTVEQLRQQAIDEEKSFAVAYLGYMTADYETVYDYIGYICNEVTQDMPFLAQIPETNIVTNAVQGEVYCIIPADPEAIFQVYTGSAETALIDLLYEGSGEEPYLLVCNSDASPDMGILIEDSQGMTSIWNPKLDEYLFVEQPRYASGETDSLDFSPYNALLTDYYNEMLAEDSWEIPAVEYLRDTDWSWDGMSLNGGYYFYYISFHEDTLDVFWNPGYGEDCEYLDAAWSYDHGILTIDFDQFAGVRNYNLLVDAEEGVMYIATDASGQEIYWDSEPLYRFLIKNVDVDTTSSVEALLGLWERTQTEVEGEVNQTPAGQVMIEIYGSSEDDLWIRYTDNEFPDNNYVDKAVIICTDGDTMGFGDVSWTAEIDHVGNHGKTFTLAIVDGELILRNYFVVDGAPMVSYETFRRIG